MLWCMLLVMTKDAYADGGHVYCYVGRQQKNNIRLIALPQNRMCAVGLHADGSEFVFKQVICTSRGCHLNASTDALFCCCDTYACNTIEFFKLSTRSYHLTIYTGYFVVPLIVIAKLLMLLIINCGCGRTCCNGKEKFHERIHLDLTQFHTLPKLAASELDYVIEGISRESSLSTSIALSSVQIRSVLTYSTSDRITFREAKEQARLVGLDKNSKMEDILAAVIRLGPCEINYDWEVMIAIVEKAHEVLAQEPTLLELSVPITIYGDIHGQYSDIWRWFHVNGWPPNTRCLFLGDYVDRGRHSTETYNFYSELRCRIPRKSRTVYKKIADLFSVMPIACLISGQILCMHGGLSPRIQMISEIMQLQRPLLRTNPPGVHIDIMWSDPHPAKWNFEPNTLRDPGGVGVGYLFGTIQIKQFVKRNELSLIVRGHQPPMGGYERVGPYLITIFSTPGYRVEQDVGNMGASLVIDEDGTMDIIRIQAGEQLKLKRQRYKMDKGDSYRDCGKPKLKKPVASYDEKYS
ncbi:hypothetical protein Q1695_001751 [Nippostrongylus brasiliensis]|nr:hypothetical protein Q1695_001751 [Nippostrongylus brasiliensis]